ncbi:MAG: MFS transporter [Eubacteriales bacterium]|nr:MFS transporter [Eubacteriales bacterium]
MSKFSSSSVRAPALLPVFSALMFFVGFEMGGFQLALRSISGELSVGTVGGGLLVAVQYASVILMPFLFGRLSDRAGKRTVTRVFSLVFLAGCLLAALSRGVFAFAAGVFCVGAGYSVCESAGSAALADASPEHGARWVNLSQGALSIGAVCSPILTQFGTTAFGWSWRAVFWICAAGALAALAPLLLIRFPAPVVAAGAQSQKPARAFFADPAFTLFFCAILLYVGLESGFGYFTESFFALKLNAASFGAYAISAYWASMAVSRFFFGFLPLKPERTLELCLPAAAVLFGTLALLRASIPALAVSALIGFSFGPVWSCLMNLAAQRHPGNSGGAMGLMSAGCGLGGAVFPALMGLISDRLDLRAAFFLLALSALTGGALSFLAARKKSS